MIVRLFLEGCIWVLVVVVVFFVTVLRGYARMCYQYRLHDKIVTKKKKREIMKIGRYTITLTE